MTAQNNQEVMEQKRARQRNQNNTEQEAVNYNPENTDTEKKALP